MANELRERELADEHDVAKFLGVSVQALRKWRQFSPPKGPSFMVIVGRAVYPIQSLKDWAAAHPPTRTRKGFLKYPLESLRPEPEVDLFDAFQTSLAAEEAESHTSDARVESVNPFPIEKG